ncbi:MAG: 2-amino-4-hydroxy-6-hydroxymethyldihydropteridine diphosphokinase [Anaerolineae bacterium]
MASTLLLALGSNIEPRRNLSQALALLSLQLDITAVSSVYETKPVGGAPQPAYLNAAVLARSDTAPERLKHGLLRPIEARLGRVRSADRYAPRTIDIDIALYGDLVCVDEKAGLEIPDPEIELQAHLAVPLAEVAPDLVHPVSGRTLTDIAEQFQGRPEVRRVTFALGVP